MSLSIDFLFQIIPDKVEPITEIYEINKRFLCMCECIFKVLLSVEIRIFLFLSLRSFELAKDQSWMYS